MARNSWKKGLEVNGSTVSFVLGINLLNFIELYLRVRQGIKMRNRDWEWHKAGLGRLKLSTVG